MKDHGKPKNPFDAAFAERLRAAMRASGVTTATELAKLLGQAGSRVRNWCNGTSTPPSEDGVRLAEMLGVTMDYLYRGQDAGLSDGKRIRLFAAMRGSTPPSVPSRMEQEPASESRIPSGKRPTRKTSEIISQKLGK